VQGTVKSSFYGSVFISWTWKSFLWCFADTGVWLVAA